MRAREKSGLSEGLVSANFDSRETGMPRNNLRLLGESCLHIMLSLRFIAVFIWGINDAIATVDSGSALFSLLL